MIIKGTSDIKSIRSLNTRPGPTTEKRGFLRLYQLSAEKDNLLRKVVWVRRQKDQTEKRLSEIAHVMRIIDESIEREPASDANSELRSTFIEY